MNAGRTYCIAPIVTNGTMLQNVGGAPSSLDVPKNHLLVVLTICVIPGFFSVPYCTVITPLAVSAGAEDMEAMTILQWATWRRKKSSLLRNGMMRDFHQQRVFCVVEENKVPVPIDPEFEDCLKWQDLKTCMSEHFCVEVKISRLQIRWYLQEGQPFSIWGFRFRAIFFEKKTGIQLYHSNISFPVSSSMFHEVYLI